MLPMKKENKMFLYGASFVPLSLDAHVPMEQWEDGMKQMRDLGLNAYRAFVAWNRIEIKEGIRDFQELDYSLELAAKYDLKVTLNLGGVFGNLQGFRPPPWLVYKYHCQRRINNPLLAPVPASPDMLLCNDDPIYRQKAEEFMRAVVQRYAGHPALECWAVWNEPAGNPCYCRHTVRFFQEWLQKRYAHLEELNANWGTLFPIEFQSWNDVMPAPLEDNMVCRSQRLDWLEFCEDHFIKQVNGVAQLVHDIDQRHPTSLNVMGVHARDFTKIRVDQAGISAYIDPYPYDARKVNQWVSVFMQSARVGRRLDEKVRIIETAGGPCPFDPDHNRGDSGLAEVRDWGFVANGASMILNWKYRSRISGGQACQFSMTGWDGSPTERLKQAGQRANIFRRNSERILNAHPFAGQVGVLHDMKMFRLATVFGFHSPNKNYCMATRDHSLMIVKDAGFSMEYLMDSHLFDGTASRFKAILIPFCPFVTPAVGAALREYVQNGGVLIAEAAFALKDHYGIQYWRKTPGAGLDEVFGFQAVDMLVLEDEDRMVLNNGTHLESASHFREVITPLKNAEILGRYRDGAPAVISHRYGKGRTLFFGSMMLHNYGWQSRGLRDMLRDFIGENDGITPLYRLETEPEFEPLAGGLGVYPVTVDNHAVDGIYLVNYNKAHMKFRLNMATERLGDACFTDIADIVNRKQYRPTSSGSRQVLEFDIGGQQAIALFRNG